MHPNDPDNKTDLDALISAEADAIMAECCDLKSAYYFADNWEALLDVRGELLNMVARILATDHPQHIKEAAIGASLIDRVRRAAMKRAAEEVKNSSSEVLS